MMCLLSPPMDHSGRASDNNRYNRVVPEREQPMMNTGDVINLYPSELPSVQSRAPASADVLGPGSQPRYTRRTLSRDCSGIAGGSQ